MSTFLIALFFSATIVVAAGFFILGSTLARISFKKIERNGNLENSYLVILCSTGSILLGIILYILIMVELSRRLELATPVEIILSLLFVVIMISYHVIKKDLWIKKHKGLINITRTSGGKHTVLS